MRPVPRRQSARVARALRIRQAEVELPTDDPYRVTLVTEQPPPNTGERQHLRTAGDYTAFHNDANEHRFVSGGWNEPGEVVVWIRCQTSLVDGRPLSPLQRVAAAADFGNGVSSVLPWDQYTFINPDLTIHQHRNLVGEWVGMHTKTHMGPRGVAFAESELFDQRGRLGRSVQSLLVERRSDW